MQSNVPTDKLIGVSEAISKLGRLLWDEYPQQPLEAISLQRIGITSDLPLAATGSILENTCVDGGSAAAEYNLLPQ